jgi:hypothetical protein
MRLLAPQPFVCVHGVLTEFYVCSETLGLAWATDEQTLKEAFSSFGAVMFPVSHTHTLSLPFFFNPACNLLYYVFLLATYSSFISSSPPMHLLPQHNHHPLALFALLVSAPLSFSCHNNPATYTEF